VKTGDLAASAGHPQQEQGTVAMDLHVDVPFDDAAQTFSVAYDPPAEPVSRITMDLPVYAYFAGQDASGGAEGGPRPPRCGAVARAGVEAPDGWAVGNMVGPQRPGTGRDPGGHGVVAVGPARCGHPGRAGRDPIQEPSSSVVSV
jgi:hypothetical protein